MDATFQTLTNLNYKIIYNVKFLMKSNIVNAKNSRPTQNMYSTVVVLYCATVTYYTVATVVSACLGFM